MLSSFVTFVRNPTTNSTRKDNGTAMQVGSHMLSQLPSKRLGFPKNILQSPIEADSLIWTKKYMNTIVPMPVSIEAIEAALVHLFQNIAPQMDGKKTEAAIPKNMAVAVATIDFGKR